jgi:hypothetical protein
MDPTLNSEGRGIGHANCTDDAKDNVKDSRDGGSRNSSVMEHGL